MEENSTQEVVATETTQEETQPITETTETNQETKPAVEVEQPEIVFPPPKKQTAQERINELTRKRREAEREAEQLRQKLAEKDKPQGQQTNRPRLENFETQELYEDALLDWKLGEIRQEETVKQRQKDEEDAIAKFNEKAKQVKKVYEDFDEVVERPVFSPTMRDTLLRSEEGAMVSYFLGRPENEDIAYRIQSLPPQSQIYELGKLETKLILAQKTKTTTQAPPPVKPVGITGGATTDPSKMSINEWMEWDKQKTLEKIKSKSGG